MDGYEKTHRYRHNERPAKIDISTGEIKEFPVRVNNLPVGKKFLRYMDFAIVNNSAIVKLRSLLDNESMGVVFYMISMADFNTNSLSPLCDGLTIRDKAMILNISKNKVEKICSRLFFWGVFLTMRVCEESDKEYWVLNPNISWKGKMVDDSLFHFFKKTRLSRELENVK